MQIRRGLRNGLVFFVLLVMLTASVPARGQAKEPTLVPPPRSYEVEWFGARGAIGAGALLYRGIPLWGMAEISLFTLVWKHFYIECLRIGSGIPNIFYWGTALGFPWHIGGGRKHQLRFGVHLTLQIGYWPAPSGVQIYYILRLRKHFALQFGLMQYSYPPGGTFTFGFSI